MGIFVKGEFYVLLNKRTLFLPNFGRLRHNFYQESPWDTFQMAHKKCGFHLIHQKSL